MWFIQIQTFWLLSPKYCIESTRSDKKNKTIPAATTQNAGTKIAIEIENETINVKITLYVITSVNDFPKFNPIFLDESMIAKVKTVATPSEMRMFHKRFAGKAILLKNRQAIK